MYDAVQHATRNISADVHWSMLNYRVCNAGKNTWAVFSFKVLQKKN